MSRGRQIRILDLKQRDARNGLSYFALAGGTIPFILKYSTICP
jgi:hypothetical protein